MKELELAYIAGFLDGEGTIGISKNTPQNPKDPHKTPRYELQVAVVNTCLDPLLLCQKRFGGGIYTRKHLPRHKLTYHWTVAQKASVTLIKAVLPYLIIKKRQAELALKFMEAKTNVLGWRKRVPDEELALRESYYWQMRQLNS